MLKPVSLLLLLLVLLAASMPLSWPAPAASAASATVAIDTTQPRQTIRGIGGNFARGRFTGLAEPNDPVGAYTLDTLQPSHVRVGIPLKAWEPANDDAGVDTINWPAFRDSGDVHNVFVLLQTMQQRGMRITASVWDVPDWLVADPGRELGRTIPAARYAELVESLSAFLLHARDRYGVAIEYVSFNEPDAGINILLSADEYAAIVKIAGPRFAALNLPTRWLVGDTSGASSMIAYATSMLQDEAAQPYLGPLAYHSWDGQVSDAMYRLALEYKRELWCTEVGYDAMLYLTPEVFGSWEHAWKLARNYHQVLQNGASVTHYWEYQDDFPLLDGATLTPYPSYYVVKQLADHLPGGSRIVSSRSSNNNILALAATHASGVTVQLINTGAAPLEVQLTGLPDSTMALIRTSPSQQLAYIDSYTVGDNSLTLVLPTQSISTLSTRLPAATDAPPVAQTQTPGPSAGPPEPKRSVFMFVPVVLVRRIN